MTGQIQDNITRFWDLVAGDYEHHPGNVVPPGSPAYAAWRDGLCNVLPPPPCDLLDVGAGTGFLTLMAAELGHRVTALDLSNAMLAIARQSAIERGLAIEFRIGDAVEPPFPPASFDAVINRSLVWTLRELGRAARAWRALLRPGGRVVILGGFATGPTPEPDVAPDEDAGGNIFLQHYTPAVRAALPAVHVGEDSPILAALRGAGFASVEARRLPDVERLDEAYWRESHGPPHAVIASG